MTKLIEPKPKKAAKKPKKPLKVAAVEPEAKAKEKNGKRGKPMITRIFELISSASKKKPISRGDLYDTLVKEFVPPRKESDVMNWISYAPGYLNQQGHTVHSEGRGADRTFWMEQDTHAPWGRFAKDK